MDDRKKIVICTIKSWNLIEANKFKTSYQDDYEVTIISAKENLTCETLDKINPEYILFPHWSYLIPQNIYEKYCCVVFHMTDLPFGRGGSPLQNLIVRGIQETVISAIQVGRELDAGAIYIKRQLQLYGSAQEIFERACQIVFRDMIPYLLRNHPEPVEQVGEIVNFKRRHPRDSILPQDASTEKLYDHIRMLDAEGYPPAFIKYGEFRLCFKNARFNGEDLTAEVVFTREI